MTKKKLVIFGSSVGGIKTANTILPHLKLRSNIALWVPHLEGEQIGSQATLSGLGGEFFSEPNEIYPIHSGKLYVVCDPNTECRSVYVTFRSKYQVTVHLSKGIESNINRTFAAAARVYRHDLFAIILSGAGNDGTEGAKIVKRYGGTVIVQKIDPSIDKNFSGSMPSSAIASRTVDYILPLDEIVRYVNCSLQ